MENENKLLNETNKKMKMKKTFSMIMSIMVVAACCVVSVTFGKYIVSRLLEGNSQTAKWGTVKLYDHKVVWNEKETRYDLTDDTYEVSNNQNINDYDSDHLSEPMNADTLPKAPYVLIQGPFEVACELYMKVISIEWPDIFGYQIHDIYTVDKNGNTGKWRPLVLGDRFYDPTMEIYQYYTTVKFMKNQNERVYILKDNVLTLSAGSSGMPSFSGAFQHLASKNFSLSFSLWIEQVNENVPQTTEDRNSVLNSD